MYFRLAILCYLFYVICPNVRECTCLLNCSEEPYEGGDLCLFRDKEIKIENFNPGTAIVFPSFINHKVEKITSGSRASLAIWMNGPKFR